jgi:hypothetical protein
MAQCLHLDSRGQRCRREADEGAYFCDKHYLVAAPEPLGARLRRWGLRLAALVLLVVFLLPLAVQAYRFLRAMLN